MFASGSRWRMNWLESPWRGVEVGWSPASNSEGGESRRKSARGGGGTSELRLGLMSSFWVRVSTPLCRVAIWGLLGPTPEVSSHRPHLVPAENLDRLQTSHVNQARVRVPQRPRIIFLFGDLQRYATGAAIAKIHSFEVRLPRHPPLHRSTLLRTFFESSEWVRQSYSCVTRPHQRSYSMCICTNMLPTLLIQNRTG